MYVRIKEYMYMYVIMIHTYAVLICCHIKQNEKDLTLCGILMNMLFSMASQSIQFGNQ